MLRDQQAAFARLLLGQDARPDSALVAALALPDTAQGPQQHRLGVHRATVQSGLTEALAATFPVLVRLVGMDFFASLAGRFIAAHPPSDAPLLRYGSLLPVFIAQDPTAASLPYLGDVARLELAHARSYYAAEAAILTADDLAAVVPEALGDLRLALHPSCRFVISPYPVDRIWRDNQEDAESGDILDLDAAMRAGPTRLLVHRPGPAVVMMPLGAGTVAFLMGLSAGQSLTTAWGSGLGGDGAFDLAMELARCLAAGVFTARSGAEQEPEIQ